MPELKRSFQAGKMNKDSDERLVPNGEYRDAMNIQVRTTDGGGDDIGDAGTVQNIKGNSLIEPTAHLQFGFTSSVIAGANTNSVIGSVADEKTNSIYFLIAGANLRRVINSPTEIVEKKLFIDTILEIKETSSGAQSTPVVVDKYAIVDTYSNVFGTMGPNGVNPYQQVTLPADNSVIDDLSPGFKLTVWNNQGFAILRNVEIQHVDKDNNVLTFYDQQSANLQMGGYSLVFQRDGALNFSTVSKTPVLVTGLNVIDNLLFWTDNRSEPKKINIDRCKKGCTDFTTHTQLYVTNPLTYDYNLAVDDDTGTNGLEFQLSPFVNNDIREEHMVVMRQAPLTAPNIEMSVSDRDGQTNISAFQYNFVTTNEDGSQNFLNIGDEITIVSEDFNNVVYMVNDILKFTAILEDNTTIVLSMSINSISPDQDTGNTQITFTVLTTFGVTPNNESTYWEIELEKSSPLFELKLGRFGYRYKYTDGEYSSFSPWSELAFLPGPYESNHKKGYNLGMVNTARNIIIKDFIPHSRTRPLDIQCVDILYKTTDNQNIYVVKTIEREKDPEWQMFVPGGPLGGEGLDSMVFGRYSITSEMIYKTLPANQTLRAWDNVPRFALAQEMAANRVVYANYTQGYDITNPVGLIQNLKSDTTANPDEPKKSVKSVREYRFGMVFGDRYGRETPVISPGLVAGGDYSNYSVNSGDVRIPKKLSKNRNWFELKQDWEQVIGNGVPEQWMDYVKYYVKETSNEYYNLVMDRWYEAEDGNIWLSFSSADRNKVDEDTYLILKNEHGSNTAVEEKARYKVIAIQNEAPDFIKLDPRDMGKIPLDPGQIDGVFVDDLDANPEAVVATGLVENTQLKIDASVWQNFLDDYNPRGNLKIRIVGSCTAVDKILFSNYRTITRHSPGVDEGDDCTLVWNKNFGASADMYSRFVALGAGSTVTGLKYELEIREMVVDNKPEYEGRFFVKIEKDLLVQEKIQHMLPEQGDLLPVASFPLSYIDSQPYSPAMSGTYSSYQWGNAGDPTADTSSANNSDGGNIATDPPFAWTNIAAFALGLTNEYNPDDVDQSSISIASSSDEDDIGFDPFGDSSALVNIFFFNWGGLTKDYWEWQKEYVGDTINPSFSFTPKTKMFIDSARARRLALNDYNSLYNDDQDGLGPKSREYYKPTGLDEGRLTGPNFFPTVGGELGRMFVSISDRWQDGSNGTSGFIGSELSFKNKFSQAGTVFRFDDDPNGVMYITVSNESTIDEIARGIPFISGPDTQFGALNFEPIAEDIFGSTVGEENVLIPITDPNFNFLTLSDTSDVGVDNNDNNSWDYTLHNFGGGADIRRFLSVQESDVSPGDAGFYGIGIGVQTSAGGYSVPPSFDDDFTIDGFDVLSGLAPLSVLNENFPYTYMYGGDAFLMSRSGFRFEFRRLDANNMIIPDGGIQTDIFDPRGELLHDGRNRINITVLDRQFLGGGQYIPTDQGAVWETEPKEDVGLDIYYEASNSIPMVLNSENTPLFAPYNSKITVQRPIDNGGFNDVVLSGSNHHVWTIGYTQGTSIIGVKSTTVGDTATLHTSEIEVGDFLIFEHSDGTKTRSKVTAHMSPLVEHGDDANLNETVFRELTPEVDGVDFGFSWSGNYSNGSAVFMVTGASATELISAGISFNGSLVTDPVDNTLGDQGIPENTYITSYTIDGSNVFITLSQDDFATSGDQDTDYKVSAFPARTGYYEIESKVFKYPVELAWHNCYSFGNGVESDRIRDDFNAPTIDNGIIVSTTFTGYGQETKGSGLIYSGLYNSTSGVNDLNEFNMAEKITKDLNPSYGSIQALKTRDTNIVALAEDKILQITTNRDALFNADGNPQLLASNKVLGTAVPFSGDYGISKNPESLATDQFRMYFTDSQRGAVLRLSRDGLTPISSVGMKTYFRNNLKKADSLIGTFDTVNGEYNLTIKYKTNLGDDTTVSFNESSKGWVSFKSFVLESGKSTGGKYFTGLKNAIYEHHLDVIENGVITNRNTFYNSFEDSYVSVLFNDMPGVIKDFKTMNYEGSQARVQQSYDVAVAANITDAAGNSVSTSDNEYYNLTPKKGWYVESFTTDLQNGSIPEFIEKENKWFNKIQGADDVEFVVDASEFSTQGIGTCTGVVYTGNQFELSVGADLVNDDND